MWQSTNGGKYSKVFTYLFIGILVIGLALRFYQFLMGRPLWDDEAHLALNIVKYDYERLSKPLDFIQIAPIFFLYAVKTTCIILGNGEYALRFVPFIFSVLTFPLFYYIILELTQKRQIALIGFFVFAINAVLIYFSSELKQYAVDVSMYLLLTYLAIGTNKTVARYRDVLLAVVGTLSILFSSVAFISLFCIGCYKLLNWINNKKIRYQDILIFIPWAIVFTINYFWFIHNHPSTADQKVNYAFAFCPVDILSGSFFAFASDRCDEIFFSSLLKFSKVLGVFKYLLLVIIVAAFTYIIKARKYNIIIFVCLPITLHLVLSALKLYPFWYRLILYLMPAFIVLVALGTYQIGLFLTRKINLWAGVVFVLGCSAVYAKKSVVEFPIWPLDIRHVIWFINDNYSPKKHVYITTPINPYTYYQWKGTAKVPVFQEVQWVPWWPATPNEFEEQVSREDSSYLFVYGDNYYEWGYGKIVDYLKNEGRVIKSYTERGYEVSEIRPKNYGSFVLHMDNSYFNTEDVWKDDNGLILMPIWSDKAVAAKPIALPKGKYMICVVSKGNPGDGVYPHNNVIVNSTKIGDYSSTYLFGRYAFPLELADDQDVVIKVDMDNDAGVKDGDRNTFIKYINIYKVD